MAIISEKWQNRWTSNEVIVLVLASLGIQIGLIFLAPLRKRSTNTFLILLLWLLYLTADYVATLALGNISKKIGPAEIGDSETIQGDLTVFWVPFLLLHLGGPDSITSYSFEDNELWWRHLLGLVVQVVITFYVFWQSPPNGWLLVPTTLVFISGLIKFAERTHALRLGSKSNLKDKIISELGPANENEKVDFISKIEKESEIEREHQFIMEGYGWLNIFKRLWVDVTFSSNLLMQSQDRFSEISPTEAFKLVAIELSFLYDILHTKAVHIHCTLGRVLRSVSLISILVALVVFYLVDSQEYASKDIIITYILFGAGLFLEVIATVLLVLSDWTVMSLSRREGCKCFASAITAMLNGTLRNGKPRWSRTIGQYNIIDLFLRDRNTVFTWIMTKLKINDKWDNIRVTRLIPVTELLEDILFTEAIKRAQNVHVPNVLVEARSYKGSKALEYHDQLKNLEWSMKREFDECIILWHLATDICYYKDNYGMSEREVGWQISNYMVYLLIRQPSMMQLGYGTTRFEATRALVKNLSVIKNKFRGRGKIKDNRARDMLEENEVCVPVLVELVDDFQPGQVFVTDRQDQHFERKKKEKPKQVPSKDEEDEMGKLALNDSLKLANKLMEIHPEIRWKLISDIWMEMLIYAAIHCDLDQHAKSLSRGGELLTHLWLLMVQLGVLEDHRIQKCGLEIV